MGPQDLLPPLLLAAYAVPYILRARTLRRRGRPVPAWRLACFAGAVALLIAATSPPVGRLADRRLSAARVEHLSTGALARRLAVLGCSGPLLARLLRTPLAELLRVVARPVVAFRLGA